MDSPDPVNNSPEDPSTQAEAIRRHRQLVDETRSSRERQSLSLVEHRPRATIRIGQSSARMRRTNRG